MLSPVIKAVTLTQPWASLIALGAKRIETRSWRTHYRGPLAIHAAKGLPTGLRIGQELVLGDWRVERDRGGLILRNADPEFRPYRLPTSVIVAVTTLFQVRSTDSLECAPSDEERALGDYSTGRYAWSLSNIAPLTTPVHGVRGRLGLWNWTPPAGLLDSLPYHGRSTEVSA
jgi:hypothetical protein